MVLRWKSQSPRSASPPRSHVTGLSEEVVSFVMYLFHSISITRFFFFFFYNDADAVVVDVVVVVVHFWDLWTSKSEHAAAFSESSGADFIHYMYQQHILGQEFRHDKAHPSHCGQRPKKEYPVAIICNYHIIPSSVGGLHPNWPCCPVALRTLKWRLQLIPAKRYIPTFQFWLDRKPIMKFTCHYWKNTWQILATNTAFVAIFSAVGGMNRLKFTIGVLFLTLPSFAPLHRPVIWRTAELKEWRGKSCGKRLELNNWDVKSGRRGSIETMELHTRSQTWPPFFPTVRVPTLGETGIKAVFLNPAPMGLLRVWHLAGPSCFMAESVKEGWLGIK